VSSVLPVLNVRSDVKDDIRDAVAVGKTATVSQNQITVGNWTGVGYIITDQNIGTGAYMISGGSNGAELLIGVGLFTIAFLITATWALPVFLYALMLLTMIVGIVTSMNALIKGVDSEATMGALATILGIFAIGAVSIVDGITVFAFIVAVLVIISALIALLVPYFIVWEEYTAMRQRYT